MMHLRPTAMVAVLSAILLKLIATAYTLNNASLLEPLNDFTMESCSFFALDTWTLRPMRTLQTDPVTLLATADLQDDLTGFLNCVNMNDYVFSYYIVAEAGTFLGAVTELASRPGQNVVSCIEYTSTGADPTNECVVLYRCTMSERLVGTDTDFRLILSLTTPQTIYVSVANGCLSTEHEFGITETLTNTTTETSSTTLTYTETETETDFETVTHSETDVETQTDSHTETETKTETKTEFETETESETETKTLTNVITETETETHTVTKTSTDVSTSTETVSTTDTKTSTTTSTKTTTESETETETDCTDSVTTTVPVSTTTTVIEIERTTEIESITETETLENTTTKTIVTTETATETQTEEDCPTTECDLSEFIPEDVSLSMKTIKVRPNQINKPITRRHKLKSAIKCKASYEFTIVTQTLAIPPENAFISLAVTDNQGQIVDCKTKYNNGDCIAYQSCKLKKIRGKDSIFLEFKSNIAQNFEYGVMEVCKA